MSREEPCFEVEVLAFSQLVKWEGRVTSQIGRAHV